MNNIKTFGADPYIIADPDIRKAVQKMIQEDEQSEMQRRFDRLNAKIARSKASLTERLKRATGEDCERMNESLKQLTTIEDKAQLTYNHYY